VRQARSDDAQGEYVDVALTEAVFSFTESPLTEYSHEDKVQERTGNQLLRSAP
jgi:crotonobetainyl-CoA:carnitine CoA-transferase CaiB-like acyl-CoA transferase